MKMEKKLIIVSLILLSLFMISAVSAASNTTETSVNSDVNNEEKVSHTTTTNTDASSNSESVTDKSTSIDTNTPIEQSNKLDSEKNIKKLSTNNNDEKLVGAKNNSKILSSNPGTYSDLSSEIGNGGNIDLTHDYYTYNSGSTIEISLDNSVINGNGAIIDMTGSNIRAFQITASGVTIKNLTIKNANYKSDSGGAIWFSQSGTVENCNFTNNKATNFGGAVYFNSDSSTGTIKNCNFMNNTVKAFGGAIEFKGTGNVTNCNFTNNKVTTDNGGAIYFDKNGEVTNCNFIYNQATGDYSGYGGAIWFTKEGNVTNCNFTNNTASFSGGAVYFLSDISTGTIKNCNFTNNTASKAGGAVYFLSSSSTGTIKNCNFTNNSASNSAGAVLFSGDGNVTNCNFTNNSASINGGAVLFWGDGTVTNCNFTYNKATTGSAINFDSSSSTKSISNSLFLNNRANADSLELVNNGNTIEITFKGRNNLLNAIYSNYGEVSFTNVTYWGANGLTNTGSSLTTLARSNNEAGQNITVGIIVNDVIVLNEVRVTGNEGKIVVTDVNIDDDDNYYIGARHNADSYYTEAEGHAQNNMQFYVNVNPVTTNDKAVNITAKSNIYNEFMPGKLLFILPNSAEISANYTGDGEWWALYTFADYGDYNVSASYIGLGDVTINNGTISIRQDVPITVNDMSISYSEVAKVVVGVPTAINGQNVTIIVNTTSKNATVNNGKAQATFTDLPVGEHLITVKYLGDNKHSANSTTAKLTVNKKSTTITTTKDNINLYVNGEDTAGAILNPTEAGNLTYSSSNTTVATVDNTGKIIAKRQGTATITVSFKGNTNYTAATSRTIQVTVKLNPASVTVNNNTLNLKIDDTFELVATTTPGGLNVTYVPDESGVVTVDENGKITALKEGTAKIIVKVGGDGVYALNSTTVNVTVSKIHTEIIVKNNTINMKVNDEVDPGVSISPADAGELDYTSSDVSVVVVNGDGTFTAVGDGNANVTIRFNGNDKYATAISKIINVTVTLNDANITVNNNTLNLLVDEEFTIIATTTPEGLNVTYLPDNSGIVTVDENGKIKALKEGTAHITVKINGKGAYFENSTTVTVTVSKIPSPTPSPSPEPTINPTKTVYKVKMYLTLKKVKKISKKTKKLYLKVIVKRNGKKLLTKKITIKVKRNKVKAKKTNKNKAKSKKLSKVQGFKFTVKINGKTYTQKTNKKGKITYTITNLYKKGTYKAKISYKSKYYKKNGKNIKFKIKA